MNHVHLSLAALVSTLTVQTPARTSSSLDGNWLLADSIKASSLCPASLNLSTEVRTKADTEKGPSMLDPEAGRYSVRYTTGKGLKIFEWSGSTIASQYPDGETKETAFVTYTGISSQKSWNNCAKVTFPNCSGTQDFSVHSGDGLSLNFKLQRRGLNVPLVSAECEYKRAAQAASGKSMKGL